MTERTADNPRIQQEASNDEGQDQLLALFHPDPERARKEYDRLRSRLTKMCELRGFVRVEELIQKTFRIVSRELTNEKVSVFAVRVAQQLLNELSQEDFDRLMARLGPDPAQAGIRYEAIRNELVKFFSSRRCQNPDELADRSLDRLAKRLANVDIQNFSSYARRIAKFVVQESWRAPEEIPLESKPDGDNFLPAPDSPNEMMGTPDEDERMMAALEQCLDQLDQDKRDTVLTYHDTTPETEEFLRKRLALQLGISMDALRVRAFRTRQALEVSVNQQMAKL